MGKKNLSERKLVRLLYAKSFVLIMLVIAIITVMFLKVEIWKLIGYCHIALYVIALLIISSKITKY